MKFKSPLAISNLFWTPESMDDIEKHCLSYPKKERVAAMLTMAFTVNMCAKAVQDEADRQATTDNPVETIQNLLDDAIQMDLENGVGWINDEAHVNFSKAFPSISQAFAVIGNMDSDNSDDDLVEDWNDMNRDMKENS